MPVLNGSVMGELVSVKLEITQFVLNTQLIAGAPTFTTLTGAAVSVRIDAANAVASNKRFMVLVLFLPWFSSLSKRVLKAHPSGV